MQPEDFGSEDKEILSWDINDMKLPQVGTCGKNLPSAFGSGALTVNVLRPGRKLVRVPSRQTPPELRLDIWPRNFKRRCRDLQLERVFADQTAPGID